MTKIASTDAQRAEIEKLRVKADLAVTKLLDALDETGHDFDCVLRCLAEECYQDHSCDLCREDGEV